MRRAEALRRGLHRRVLAVALLVFGQCGDQVLRRLAADLWHVKVRVGIPVAGDAVATLAGVGELLSALRVANDGGS